MCFFLRFFGNLIINIYRLKLADILKAFFNQLMQIDFVCPFFVIVSYYFMIHEYNVYLLSKYLPWK